MHEVHYVRLSFEELSMDAFVARIEATMDGGAFIDVQNANFIRQHDQAYIFAFDGPISSRGLRIVPARSVVLRRNVPHSVQIFGVSIARDLHTFDPCLAYFPFNYPFLPRLPTDMLHFNRSYLAVGEKLVLCYLWVSPVESSKTKMKCLCATEKPEPTFILLGPMVSQVLSYQHEENLFFGLGPERMSIVKSHNLQWPWIGINLYRYQIDGLDKGVTRATYLPWEATEDFNPYVTGSKCKRYSHGNWHRESINVQTLDETIN
ncbi:unnamed protein product [Echinostoma caproni]|uniref:DUF295 domain-containing protein n=1 Tax=Echinostoma caproni TaxID=27848 RepID=A0A183B5W4_9TREM|nr:unnamed protein product [Echinostoma caproni]